eukprot:TRINITY_DN2735_c0_g3_i1.p1 TRINITY_DN2735_c0_g3~~TRINITY_DN2735_c0_g3_i1.p1  ORF type:complete len:485 (-),score=120.58 TRINITY_DN2735_c0_g3_i1:429-1883(-)
MPPKSKKSAAASSSDAPAKKPRIVRAVDPHFGGGEVYEDFDCMLNQANIQQNNNKFYVIQIIQTGSNYVCWTRWGRVGESGQILSLGDGTLETAKRDFEKKFKDKTGNDWAKRGSFKAKAGKYTLILLKQVVEGGEEPKDAKEASAAAPSPKSSPKLSPEMPPISSALAELITYIFKEAKHGLTSSMDATITANGIETPLGVLSLEQVAVGDKILQEAMEIFNSSSRNKKKALEEISSKFYTAIPHRVGRQRPPVLDSMEMFKQKSDLLELMRDLVNISNTRSKDTLLREDATSMYATLGCTIEPVDKHCSEYNELLQEIEESQKRSHGTAFVKVQNIYRVTRGEERTRFTKTIGNQRRLYHGSRIANWVGLLSRGILMPKVVTQLGVRRTDAGWLGSGIYFGEADTAAGYAGYSATKHTAFMLMVRVALGKVKDYNKITYGLNAPPSGYDSTHGVAGTEFYDHEYVIYDPSQQQIEYLVEFNR